PDAWRATMGDPAVKVLIIDVGVDPAHPELNQDPGEDFTGQGSGGAPVNPCDNHGTWVAGCVSGIAGNARGTTGVAPLCKSVSARTFISNPDCGGGWSAQYSWTVDALAWAVSRGIRITNNSNIYGSTSSAINAKYQETRDQDGVIHFVAAGNDGKGA